MFAQAEQLLRVAPGDFGPSAPRVRTLLKDIADQRGLKVHDGLRHMDADTSAVKLNNLSAMEVNSVRDFLATGMDLFFKLKDADNDEAGGGAAATGQYASSAGYVAVPKVAPAIWRSDAAVRRHTFCSPHAPSRPLQRIIRRRRCHCCRRQ